MVVQIYFTASNWAPLVGEYVAFTTAVWDYVGGQPNLPVPGAQVNLVINGSVVAQGYTLENGICVINHAFASAGSYSTTAFAILQGTYERINTSTVITVNVQPGSATPGVNWIPIVILFGFFGVGGLYLIMKK